MVHCLMYLFQDFLSTQTFDIEQLHTDLFLGEKWLKQMGEAASRYGLNLQYCMALPRQILASLEIPAVTQVYTYIIVKQCRLILNRAHTVLQ